MGRYAIGVVVGMDIVNALDLGQNTGASAHREHRGRREGVGIGARTDNGPNRTVVGSRDFRDRLGSVGRTRQRRLDAAGRQRRDRAGRRCRTGRRRHSGRTLAGAGARWATFDHEGFEHREGRTPPNPRCPATRGSDAAGPEGRRTRLRRSSDGAMVDDGPRRNGNRGANGYGARFLDERLNQTVSIHPGKTDAPTHRNPGIHGFPIPRERRLERPRNLPRPTESDPSADLRGRSEYRT